MFNWLAERPEIDAQKIGIIGSSFGSLFSTIAASAEPRYVAVAVAATCLEPGCHTIFQEASPTFKKRFMYMSGIPNEDEFDKFGKTLTWEGHVDKIKMPYLCLAGEFDELSPLEHTERMFQAIHEGAAAARHLCGFSALRRRRTGRQSRPGSEHLYGRMDGCSIRCDTIYERALVRRTHGPHRQDAFHLGRGLIGGVPSRKRKLAEGDVIRCEPILKLGRLPCSRSVRMAYGRSSAR